MTNFKIYNLTTWFQTKDRKMLGFLSVGWGLIADVDIESEHLRYSTRYKCVISHH